MSLKVYSKIIDSQLLLFYIISPSIKAKNIRQNHYCNGNDDKDMLLFLLGTHLRRRDIEILLFLSGF